MSSHTTRCCVYGCYTNDFENPELSFFSIPTESQRRMQWLHLISRENFFHYKRRVKRVCERHFDPQDIRKKNRKTLKFNALPCLNLPQKRKQDKQTQTNVGTAGNSTQTSQTPVYNISSQTNPAVNNSSQTIQTAVNTSNTSSQIDLEESCASINGSQAAASHSADTSSEREAPSGLRGFRKRMKTLENNQAATKSEISLFNKLCDQFLSRNLGEYVKAQANFKPS